MLGNQDLRVSGDIPKVVPTHPSVLESLPDELPELKEELGRWETQLFDRPARRAQQPITPVIADANDR